MTVSSVLPRPSVPTTAIQSKESFLSLPLDIFIRCCAFMEDFGRLRTLNRPAKNDVIKYLQPQEPLSSLPEKSAFECQKWGSFSNQEVINS